MHVLLRLSCSLLVSVARREIACVLIATPTGGGLDMDMRAARASRRPAPYWSVLLAPAIAEVLIALLTSADLIWVGVSVLSCESIRLTTLLATGAANEVPLPHA